MQRTSFADMECPVARSLEQVGEWWSILILRDAFAGVTRFDGFLRSLGIAPNILTRRLNALVEAGLLERRAYCQRPLREEYVLTERGHDFRTVLVALADFGNRHFFPTAAGVEMVNTQTGELVEAAIVERRTGQRVVPQIVKSRPGPGASPTQRQRMETRAAGG